MKKIREHNGSRNGTTNAQIIPKWTEPSRVFLYIYIYIYMKIVRDKSDFKYIILEIENNILLENLPPSQVIFKVFA